MNGPSFPPPKGMMEPLYPEDEAARERAIERFSPDDVPRKSERQQPALPMWGDRPITPLDLEREEALERLGFDDIPLEAAQLGRPVGPDGLTPVAHKREDILSRLTVADIPSIADGVGAGWHLRPKGHHFDGEMPSPDSIRWRPARRGPLPEGEAENAPSPYVELHCHSCYSFREGASTPRELVATAATLGYGALAITDRDGLYGAMEFAKAAEAADIRPIIGADVTLQGGYRLVLLAETREGYANLCRLISHARLAEARRLGSGDEGERAGGRGEHPIGVKPEIPNPQIPMAVLAQHTEGLIALSGDEHGEVPALVTAGQWERAVAAAKRYAAWFRKDNFFVELQQTLTLGDTERNRQLMRLADQLGLGVIATNDVWYHVRDRHRLHDVMVAVHHRTTLDGSHQLRHANSERHLKSAEEMVELFGDLLSERRGSSHCHSEPKAKDLSADASSLLLLSMTLSEQRSEGSRLNSQLRANRDPSSAAPPQDDRVPEAICNAVRIAERCRFNLVEDLDYAFPHYPVPPGETPDSHLARICREALWRKYGGEARPHPHPVPEGEGTGPSRLDPHKLWVEAVTRLEEELGLIAKHGLAGFFLAYYDILQLAGQVAFELKGRDPTLPPDERPVARGRGSSVSSIVCYLIGLSHIDPIANELFLGRFLNDEMASVPDIDLDFPRDIREELLKRVWTEFEQGRAALVCAYSTYHTRGAIRDVGKALGLPALEIDHLAKLSDEWSSQGVRSLLESLPEYRARVDAPLWRDLAELTEQLIRMPRHVTQHVGGVVLSARPMQELVPLEPTSMEGRVMCQWDKDSVDDARMVKIDFLSLGMLSLVDECLDTIERRHGERPDLGRIPHDDPVVYERICAGDTIGLFQIESRAQIATLAMTQPRNLDDLAVQVAIVRPGPILGQAFRPYMEYRRRLREGEPVDVKYIHPCLEPVLADTLGLVLYQEQVLQVAMAVAGYTAGEADQLRRNLNRRRGAELVSEDWPAFLTRARQRSIPDEAALASFKAILGFAAYGFPKSHAVAFGLLAYESAWLRYRYPVEYYTALFNNQPMGFYSTEVIAQDAGHHGIEIARPDINLSGVGCTVEADDRIRLGLTFVKGIGRDVMGRSPVAEAVVAERDASGPFRSLIDCAERTGLGPEALENLIMSGAFDGVRSFSHGQRRSLLWELGLLRGQRSVSRKRRSGARKQMVAESPSAYRLPPAGYSQRALPLPVAQDMVALPPMSAWDELTAEYEIMGLSPQGHAMGMMRPHLDPDILNTAQAVAAPNEAEVRVAGLTVVRQRPSTAKGVVFISLEDECGMANVVVYPQLFDRQRPLLLITAFLVVKGKVRRQGNVVHIIAREFDRLNVPTDRHITVSHDFH